MKAKQNKSLEERSNLEEQHNMFMLGKQTMISSPFPPPEMLQAYKDIEPNIMERIIKFTEDNGEHRRELEKQSIRIASQQNMIEIKQRGRGLNYAFILAILSLASSVLTGFYGLEILSCILAGTTITSVVVAFLKKGNDNNKSENK